jgi:hypothetical protein
MKKEKILLLMLLLCSFLLEKWIEVKSCYALRLTIQGTQIMSVYEQLKNKRNEILRISSQYGAHKVRLGGSVLRGEERLDSDILMELGAAPDSPLTASV